MSFRSSVWNSIRERCSATNPDNWVTKDDVCCEICSNTGAMLKCFHEGCKKYCHIDCAMNTWGLAIFDDGNLKVECEYHFGTLLFCTCQTEYDELLPYVSCDSWFDSLNIKHNVDSDIENKIVLDTTFDNSENKS